MSARSPPAVVLVVPLLLLLVVLAHAASNGGDNFRYVAVGFAEGVADVVLIQGTVAGVMTLTALGLVLATRGRLGQPSGAARAG